MTSVATVRLCHKNSTSSFHHFPTAVRHHESSLTLDLEKERTENRKMTAGLCLKVSIAKCPVCQEATSTTLSPRTCTELSMQRKSMFKALGNDLRSVTETVVRPSPINITHKINSRTMYKREPPVGIFPGPTAPAHLIPIAQRPEKPFKYSTTVHQPTNSIPITQGRQNAQALNPRVASPAHSPSPIPGPIYGGPNPDSMPARPNFVFGGQDSESKYSVPFATSGYHNMQSTKVADWPHIEHNPASVSTVISATNTSYPGRQGSLYEQGLQHREGRNYGVEVREPRFSGYFR